jgi:hypothetical protein
MAVLDKKERAAIPTKKFAGPNRSFPVNDKAHAEAAILDSKYAPPDRREKIKRMAEAVIRKG